MHRAQRTSGSSPFISSGNQFIDRNGGSPCASGFQPFYDGARVINTFLDPNNSSYGQAPASDSEFLAPLNLAEQLGKAGFGFV